MIAILLNVVFSRLLRKKTQTLISQSEFLHLSFVGFLQSQFKVCLILAMQIHLIASDDFTHSLPHTSRDSVYTVA